MQKTHLKETTGGALLLGSAPPAATEYQSLNSGTVLMMFETAVLSCSGSFR